VAPVGLEAGRENFVVGHCHILRARSVKGVTDRTSTM
jgi:hypothetical protein